MFTKYLQQLVVIGATILGVGTANAQLFGAKVVTPAPTPAPVSAPAPSATPASPTTQPVATKPSRAAKPSKPTAAVLAPVSKAVKAPSIASTSSLNYIAELTVSLKGDKK